MKNNFLNFLFALCGILLFSCDSSEDIDPDRIECADQQSVLINEADSIILADMEWAGVPEGWKLMKDNPDASGEGYLRWEGDNQYQNPGNGLITFSINITNPGTYRFTWSSAVTEGSEPTESNDSWLRFPDASDFYGKKGNGNVVYPKGSDKTPTPNGASKEGWFKIYRSGNPLTFKWDANTSDNDAHKIYVTFESPGIYTMEVSGRSIGHAIDKFVLYQEAAYSKSEATEFPNFSEVGCK